MQIFNERIFYGRGMNILIENAIGRKFFCPWIWIPYQKIKYEPTIESGSAGEFLPQALTGFRNTRKPVLFRYQYQRHLRIIISLEVTIFYQYSKILHQTPLD